MAQLANDAVNASDWQSIRVQLASLQCFIVLVCSFTVSCKALLSKASAMPAIRCHMIITIITYDIVNTTAVVAL